jgi:Ca-activated chloride channel family protein
MLNPNWYYNSVTGGHGVLEVIDKKGCAGFIPLRSTILRGQLCGPLASLKVTHRFLFTEEECDRTLEALYRFPLPGDAAVSGVLVAFGETIIEAKLELRAKAEAEYETAKQEGRQAALVTRESPDVFTLHVNGIAPGKEVSVTTTYVQLGSPEGIGYSFRVPLTTMPRYVRQDEISSRLAKGQPLAVVRDPGHRFFLELTCAQGTISSQSHPLTAHGTAYTLEKGEIVPDRDLLLTWKPALDDGRPTLMALTEGESHPSFLLLFSPPAGRQQRAPLDLQILVDHSGSMNGPKWAAADWAVDKLLTSLGEEDRFNLCLFEDNTHWFRPEPVPASKAEVAAAKTHLRDRSSGGTELGLAIEQALTQPRRRGRASRHLIVITDAEVSDAGRILRLVEEERKAKEGRRCSIICIDSAPNAFLANEMAEVGGGIARFLTSSPQEGDITTALDEVLEELYRPLLKQWTIASSEPVAPGGSLDFAPQEGCYLASLEDIPAGRSRYFLLRGEGKAPGGAFILKDETGEVGRCQAEEMPGVSALYGARLVRRLEVLMASGLDRKEMGSRVRALGEKMPSTRFDNKVYAENQMAEGRALLGGLVAEISLRYGIASSETAFVAVSQKKGERATRTVVVPNALAPGWDESFITANPIMSMSSGAGAAVNNLRMAVACAPAPCDMLMDQRAPRSKKGRAGISSRPLFQGIPDWSGDRAVLFDSDKDGKEAISGEMSLLRLEAVDRELEGLTLLLFLEDMQVAKMRVRLSDLVALGGGRPVNLQYGGERLMLVLVREPGTKGPGRMSISLT